MRQRGPGGFNHRFLGDIGLPVGNVVAHGVIEEDGFLGHHADLGAQRGERDVADIVAVKLDGPCGHVKEPRNQIDESGLARAAGADDGDNFAGARFQIHVVQDLRFRAVGSGI